MIDPRAWLDHLRKNLAEARHGDEVEGVHQVRIAAARLTVFLRLAGIRVLRDDLRWLRRSAADVRDLDVALELDASEPLRAWLVEERAARRRELVATWDRPRLAGLLEALEHLQPVPSGRARQRLEKFREQVAGIDEVPDGSATAALQDLHVLRRALRRWRYALEWLDLPTEGVRRIQEELGALNDLGLVLRLLDAERAPRGLEEHRSEILSELDRGRSAARALWHDEREALLDLDGRPCSSS